MVQVQRRQGHYSAAAQNEFISALSIITILGAHIIFDNGITMIIPTEHQTQQLSQVILNLLHVIFILSFLLYM